MAEAETPKAPAAGARLLPGPVRFGSPVPGFVRPAPVSAQVLRQKPPIQKAVASVSASPAVTTVSTAVARPQRRRPRNHGFEVVNATQLRYVPASRISAPAGAVVPASMAIEMRTALTGLVERVGDLDEWLCRRLGWTMDEAARYLSAEQADAVALCLDAASRNEGTIVADATGFGKGRILAAVCRAVILDGRRCVFLTEKDGLFSDFWRDVTDIGSAELFGTPLMLNEDATIIDGISGDVLFAKTKKAQRDALLEQQALPAGYQILLATYSQFNREGRKTRMLEGVVAGAHLVMDEAQNFVNETSATNTALQKALQASGSSTFASATYARDVGNMASYRSVFPWLSRLPELPNLSPLSRRLLAEASVQAAAESGRVVRREHDFSNVSLSVEVDDTRAAEHDALSDQLTPVLCAMQTLSEAVAKLVEERNVASVSDATGGDGGEDEASPRKTTWSSANFGGRMNSLVGAFLVGLLVPNEVERCIRNLESDMKPVVVLDATMESLMRELSDDGEVNEEAGLEDVDGDVADRPPTFRDALVLTCWRIMRVGVRRKGKPREMVELGEADSAELMALLAEALRLAEAFPAMPLSPLDTIRDEVEAEGRRRHEQGLIPKPWKMGEISGRSMRVVNGRYERMPNMGRNQTVAAFNNGTIDGILLTRSGSTGLSLHDYHKFRDSRRRNMHEVRMPENVIERIQMWGRVRRNGQRSEPLYTVPCTRLPFHIFKLAAQNAKVKSLSASVTASGGNGLMMAIPDVLSPLGNEVAFELLLDNQAIATRLGVFMGKDFEEAERELYFVTTMLKRMPYLLRREQDSLFEAFLASYHRKLELHPPVESMDTRVTWSVAERRVVEPGDGSQDPVRGGDLTLTRLHRVETRDLWSADTLRANLHPAQDTAPWLDCLRSRTNTMLSRAVSAKHFRSIEHAMNAPFDNAVKRLHRRIQAALRIIGDIQPGQAAKMLDADGEEADAIILGLHLPDVKRANLLREYEVEYILPDEASPRRIGLDAMIRPGSRLGLEPARTAEVTARFERGGPTAVDVTRHILDGNAMRAALFVDRLRSGHPTHITLDDGDNFRAVSLAPRAAEAVWSVPGRLVSASAGLAALQSGGKMVSNLAETDAGVSLHGHAGQVYVRMPRHIRDTRKFMTERLSLLFDFSKVQNRFGGRQAVEVIDALMEVEPLFYDPPARQAIIAAMSSEDVQPESVALRR